MINVRISSHKRGEKGDHFILNFSIFRKLKVSLLEKRYMSFSPMLQSRKMKKPSVLISFIQPSRSGSLSPVDFFFGDNVMVLGNLLIFLGNKIRIIPINLNGILDFEEILFNLIFDFKDITKEFFVLDFDLLLNIFELRCYSIKCSTINIYIPPLNQFTFKLWVLHPHFFKSKGKFFSFC